MALRNKAFHQLRQLFQPVSYTHLDVYKRQYQGWIGCEYKPRGLTEEGLGWFDAWR